jgi:predicted DNA-binding transcriptional regulator YafY
MRRADRLFQIIQVLRRTGQPLTADAIAAELETSKRTIYRDIATLIGQRVPIRGEAGMGYILEKGFDLPPLMLTPDEIEAAVLGAQWVATHADPILSRAAQDLIAKIADTVPERLRPFVLGARQPRPAKLATRARPDRHGADARANSRRQEDHAALSRRARPRQRAHDLADRYRLSRSGTNSRRMVRATEGFSQFSYRPGDRRRLSRRPLSGTAGRLAGEMAPQPGLGTSGGYVNLRRL